jgi:hypothetical protein
MCSGRQPVEVHEDVVELMTVHCTRSDTRSDWILLSIALGWLYDSSSVQRCARTYANV